MKNTYNKKKNETDEIVKLQNDIKDEKIADWRHEHGQPNFNYLQSLANDGGFEASEKLRSIAQDLDVNFGPNISTDLLIRKILATQSDLNTTT